MRTVPRLANHALLRTLARCAALGLCALAARPFASFTSAAWAQTVDPRHGEATVDANKTSLWLSFTVFFADAVDGDEVSFTCSTTGAINNCVVPPSSLVPIGPGGLPLPMDVTVWFRSSNPGTGTLTLVARGPGGSTSGSYDVTVVAPPTYTVVVTPDGTPVVAEANLSNTQVFTVKNTGNTDATYALTCSNTMGTCSLPGGSSVFVTKNGGTKTVNVTYQAGAVGATGTVKLTAAYGGYSDAGSVSVTAQSHTVTVAPNGGPDGVTDSVPANQSNWATFIVRNTGSASATYTLTPSCPGSMGQCRLDTPTSPVTIAPGATVGAVVIYDAGAEPSSGSVHLDAKYTGNAAVHDEGWLNWTARALCAGSYSLLSPCDTTRVVVTGGAGQVDFTIRNTGDIGTIGYTLSCDAYPPQSANCVATANASAEEGESVPVVMHYTAGSGEGLTELRVLVQSSSDTAGAQQFGALLADGSTSEQLGASVHLQILSPTSVAVATPLSSARVDAGQSTSHPFTVRNKGPFQATYRLAHVCSGAVHACIPSESQVTLDPGDSALVSVSYVGGAQGDTGTVGLKATHISASAVTDTALAQITVNAYGVTIRANAQAVSTPAGSLGAGGFTIYNTTDSPNTYLVTGSCTGPAFTGACTLSADTLVVAPHDSAVDSLGYTTTSTVGTTGALFLRVVAQWDTTIRDSAFVDVTVGPVPTAGIVINGVTALASQQERGPCLTIRLTPSAAYECGDLRITHALPAVRTRNKLRVPVLLYNSQVARPHPLLAAHLTLDPAWGTPDSVAAELKIGGATRGTAQWSGASFAGGATQRIVVGFDAEAEFPDSTFANLDALNVTAKWLASGTMRAMTAGWAITVLNRAHSPFGRGWGLAGLERLRFGHLSGGTDLLWESGDGSTRYYIPVPAHPTTWWFSPSLDRPDTIKYNPTEHYYLRYAEHGAKVLFNDVGQHIKTINRLGDTTFFHYSDSTASALLDSIVVPSPAGTRVVYRFYYDPTTRLIDSVTAPGPVASGPRRVVAFHVNERGELETITDPDTFSVGFSYDPNRAGLVRSITERGGTATAFTFDDGQKLTGASTGMGEGNAPITMAFVPQETRGLLAPVAPDSAYTLLNGPRTDTTVTKLWLDAFGAPVRVRDALGYETTYQRTDSRWPALVTRVRYANGRVVSATYDSRGNLASTTDSSDYRDTSEGRKYATTRYEWDGKYDFVTKITLPEGEVTRDSIDATNGNRVWQEDGRGVMSRVNFRYYDSGEGAGLLRAVQLPGGPVDSVTYDALGNVDSTRTPRGYWTSYENDDIGRTVVIRSPIDTLGTAVRIDSSEYDLMDRVTRQVSFGPALPAGPADSTPAQSVIVLKYYNPAGLLDSLKRVSSPDPRGIGTITTRWRYDRAGRQVAEIAPDSTPADSSDNPVESTHYDAAGNPDSVHTRRGAWITMTYDALNRLTQRVVPTEVYEEEVKGIPWLPGVTDGALAPYGGIAIPADTTRYWYDRMGRLDSASNNDAKVRRSYYANGLLRLDSLRIRTFSGADFDTHKYGLEYRYDLDGRRVELRHPTQLARQGSTVLAGTTYQYDPQTGLLTSVTDPLGNLFAFRYNLRNELDSLILPWGAVEQYTYDLDGNLKTQVLDSLRRTTYQYDARGKLLSSRNAAGLRDQVHALYSGLGHLVYYHYNATGVDQLQRSLNLDVVSRYSYDALGDVFAAADTSNTVATSSGWGRVSSYSGTTSQSFYERGTGRLIVHSMRHRVDAVEYDSAGNTIFMSTAVLDPDPTTGLYPPPEDRASYYAADGRLRRADYRTLDPFLTPTAENAMWRRVEEEYRYDPLGRRVLVRTWRSCDYRLERDTCHLGTIRRIVWDGDRELYEIQMPGDEGEPATWLENDTARVNDRVDVYSVDRNPYFGRVLYTYGPALDAPLAVTRFGYADHPEKKGYGAWPVFTIVPHWNARGEADLGSVIDVSAPNTASGNYCRTFSDNQQHCLDPWWFRGAFAYQREKSGRVGWFGTLVEAKEDGTHTLYRRNRYYDPQTGRFTQEDPLGLAGGLNLYGYANGDPVNLSDPFGLCPPEDDNTSDCSAEVKRLIQEDKPLETPLVDPVAIAAGGLTGLFRGLLARVGLGAAEGAVGSSEIAATAHGAARMADASRLGAEAVKDVIANATRTGVQRDGAKVFVQAAGDRFNVVVQGERGVITNLKNISQKSLDRLAKNYGWKF